MRNTMLVSAVDLEEIYISKQVKGDQHGNSQFECIAQKGSGPE